MSIQHYQEGILPGGVDTVLPPEWLFNAPLTDSLGATGSGDTTPTFTRASVATYKNAMDELVAVASGVPRFAPEGMLIEGVRTNAITYSEAFHTSLPWVPSDATVGVSPVASPYVGSPLNANRVLEHTANDSHDVYHEYDGVANQKEALSVHGRPAGRGWCWLGWWDYSGGLVIQFYNVSTGALGGSVVNGAGVALLNPETEEYVRGWWRLKLVVQTKADTNRAIDFGPALNDGTYQYVGSAEVLGTDFFGAQVELDTDFVSSYVPTVAGTVTRQQDKLSYPSDGAPLGDGTVEAEFTKYHSGEIVSIVETVSAGLLQGARLYAKANRRIAIRVIAAGPGAIGDIESVPPDIYTPYVPRIATGYFRIGRITIYIDGVRQGTGGAASMPTVKNRISIGMSGADDQPLWGWVKNVVIHDNARVPA